MRRFAWQQGRSRLFGTEHMGHIASARDGALSQIAGHRVSELVASAVKAAAVKAIPAAAGVGAVSGAVAAGIAVRRSRGR